MNRTDLSRQKGISISRARPGDGTEIVNHVIGLTGFYIFIIKRILLTTFPGPEIVISDVEEALDNCPKCQLTLTLPRFLVYDVLLSMNRP